jgi:sodium-coupled neutral amino acid transporter 11
MMKLTVVFLTITEVVATSNAFISASFVQSSVPRNVALSPPSSATVAIHRGGDGNINARKNWRSVVNNKLKLSSSSSSSSENDDVIESSSSSEDSSASACSIPMASFNLIKGAVGSGVLSLPAGVAAIGDVKSAIIPASSILFTLGAISAYTFHLLGRLTVVANNEASSNIKVTSIGQLWEKEVGASSSWLISAAIFLTCFGTCLAYSIILGDTLSSLAQTFGISGLLATRRVNIVAISLLGVYPLSCLKSLAALAPVSLTGIVGILITCVVMTMRALPGGMYSSTAAVNYLASLPADLRPSFGVTGLRSAKSLLVLSSMTATAFLVHMAGPEVYQTLQNPTLSRFGKLSAIGFGSTALISAYMMIVGFLTFGGACKGMILNNYSTLDACATICRLFMGVSLLGSYAFLGNAMKKAWYEIFYKGKDISDKIHYRTSQFFIGIITSLALAVSDAGFVVSVTGALLGSALIYMIPSFIFLKSTRRRISEGSLVSTRVLTVERYWNKFLIGLGAFFALAGAGMSVVNTFFPHLL